MAVMNLQTCKLIAKGCLTYVPSLYAALSGTTAHTQNARYCYSVWLRHFVLASSHGMNEYPESVVELGPGGSIGTGVAALLFGASRYTALDARDHTADAQNMQVFLQLVELAKKKTPIPGPDEFPNLKPELESYEFPEGLLEVVEGKPFEKRIARIQDLLSGLEGNRFVNDGELQISIVTDWDGVDANLLEPNCADLVFSQAVMEHVADVEAVYRAADRWLKPNAFTSHQVDFKSHNTSKEWNGHWQYNDWIWFLICGRRKYLINRHPYSFHREMLNKAGLKIVADRIARMDSNLKSGELAKRFTELSPSDLETSGAFVLAQKSAIAPDSIPRHSSLKN